MLMRAHQRVEDGGEDSCNLAELASLGEIRFAQISDAPLRRSRCARPVCMIDWGHARD